MARGATKRSKAQAAKVAAPKRKPSRGARRQTRHTYEQSMFFPMLRRRAKWVFVFLALAFIVGFVVFGVGTGTGGGGLGDLFSGSNGSANGPSVSDARKKIDKNPKDAAAWQELATASLTSGDISTSISALVHYTTLKPRSTSAYTQLATLYQQKAQNLSSRIQSTQARVSALTPSQTLEPQPVSPGTKNHPGQAIFTPPVIDNTLSSIYNTRLQTLQANQRDLVTKAEGAYRTVVRLQPKNATAQLELGTVALNFGDIPTATSAFERYLKLAPTGQQAALVRKQLRLLQPPKVTQSKRKPKH